MRRETKKAAAAVCMIGLLTAAGSICAFAQSQTLTVGSSAVELNAGGPAGEEEMTAPERIRIWGTVTSVEENRIVLNNQSGVSFEGEMVLHISDEVTKVLGAVDGGRYHLCLHWTGYDIESSAADYCRDDSCRNSGRF